MKKRKTRKKRGWKLLRDAMGKRTAYSVAKECSKVGHQQLINLILGVTEPWRVSVQTADQICEALEGMYLSDFLPPE